MIWPRDTSSHSTTLLATPNNFYIEKINLCPLPLHCESPNKRTFTPAIHGKNHWWRCSEYHRKASGLLGGCCTTSTWRPRWISVGPTVATIDDFTRRLTGMSWFGARSVCPKLSPSQCFVLIKQSDSLGPALVGIRVAPFTWAAAFAFACRFLCSAFFLRSFWAALRLAEFYFRWFVI